jgi:signal recognition particle subunit SRP54
MIKQFKNAGKMAKRFSGKSGMKDLQSIMGQMGGAGALRR